jgi:hypothetical protein
MVSTGKIVFVAIIAVVIGIFWTMYRSRSRRPPNYPPGGRVESIQPGDDVGTAMRKYADGAVVEAWNIDREALDFSDGSVERVERILAAISTSRELPTMSETRVRVLATAYGAYVGEVIRRGRGGKWLQSDPKLGQNSFPLELPDGSKFLPYFWCYRRIREGREQNVWHKFQYYILKQTPPGVRFEVETKPIEDAPPRSSPPANPRP